MIAAIGCLADLWTKHSVFDALGAPGPGGRSYWVWDGLIALQPSLNEGALFGVGQGLVSILAVLSIAALLAIVGWVLFGGAAEDRWLTVALGCVTGGILGNLYDRLGLHGLTWRFPPERIGEPVHAVRDWILLQAGDAWRWPNFNIADALLVCGVGLMLWHALRVAPAAQVAPSASETKETSDSGACAGR
jgi:signal peptidase II